MSAYFSVTKRSPLARLTGEPPTDGRRRRLRLLVAMVVASILLAAWLIWRYLMVADIFSSLPRSFLESLNLLTFSSLATLSVLWLLVGYQLRTATMNTLKVSVLQLQGLSPGEFEEFAAELFRARGYTVVVRGRSGDLGVDLEIANGNGKRAIAQCKRYRSTVGPDIVRELYGTMIHERVAHAFLVTTANISDHAREWAADKPMTLIDGATLVELANTHQNLRT